MFKHISSTYPEYFYRHFCKLSGPIVISNWLSILLESLCTGSVEKLSGSQNVLENSTDNHTRHCLVNLTIMLWSHHNTEFVQQLALQVNYAKGLLLKENKWRLSISIYFQLIVNICFYIRCSFSIFLLIFCVRFHITF